MLSTGNSFLWTRLNVREWISVSDCGEALFRILVDGKIGEAYNVGSGRGKET
jgi:dTDP-D-glucose 4,6-dehydratase